MRLVAEETGIFQEYGGRYFKLFETLRTALKSFKLSTDPFFVEKVRDIVGLYPDHALVLCVDEKARFRRSNAPNRSCLWVLSCIEGGSLTTALPPRFHYALCRPQRPGWQRDHAVQTPPSSSGNSGLSPALDRNILADLDVHLVMDNYATHKHPKIKAWLARHPRYHLHFTPTYASWLNQVERWFALITQRAIRRGSFRNVRQLIKQIDDFVTHYNSKATPSSGPLPPTPSSKKSAASVQ